MANNPSNSALHVSEVDRLEQMIGKRKGRASESERQEFIDCWVSLCKRETHRAKAYELLGKGFAIAEAEPLYQYVAQTGEQEIYNKAFISIKSSEGSAGALKVALSLLAYELIAPSTDDTVDLVARRVNGEAIGRNGKPQSILKNNLGTLLVRPLSKACISPLAHIDSPRASSLANNLRPGLDAVIGKSSAKPGDVRAANELIAWLGEQKTGPAIVEAVEPTVDETPVDKAETSAHGHDMPSSSEGDSTSRTTESNPATDSHGVGSATVGRTPSRPTSKDCGADLTRPAGKNSKKSDTSKAEIKPENLDLATVISFLSGLEQEQDNLEKLYEGARSECYALSVKTSELEQKLRRSQSEVENLKDQRVSLSGNYSELQQQCEALKAENESLRNELRDANEMIAIMDEGAVHEVDATMSSLGLELAYDYRKYLDAADQPMTEELGSIVLKQLRTVFEIIKQHGIQLQ